jgi:nucleoside triphosphate pyrophosphatase
VRTPSLILASSSPRRISYLSQLGIRFRPARPDVDETPLDGEKPRPYVRRVALAKARFVSRRRPRAWVLAADTIVVLDGAILGKPRDESEARRMLARLSGRTHQVMSAMALVCSAAEKELSRLSLTRVQFREMDPAEIRWYVRTGEPTDKAGAYAIQGLGGFFVRRISGSPSNVVGFPVETFYHLIRSADLPLFPPAPRRSTTA